MRLNHNLASLNIYRTMCKTQKSQSTALQRLTSGSKLTSAKENPNAVAQSERFKMQLRGLQMAQKNAQDGVSMLQTAEGGLDGITSMLHRIKELAIQAGGGNSDSDVQIIQNEIKSLVDGIDDTVNNTEFNETNIIGDSTVTDNENPNIVKMTCGSEVGEQIDIPKYNLNSNSIGDVALGKLLSDIDVTQPGGIDEAISVVNSALDTVLSVRSKYGAIANRFESVYNSTAELAQNTQEADSELADTDVALEMMTYAKDSILMDAGNAMMAQSNKFPQDILRILQNIR